MSKRIKYSNEPIEAEVIADFLPPPEQLARAEVSVKVTIALSRRSIEFFKEAAERNNTSYQRMIRHLLDTYADQHQAALTKRSGTRSTGSRR
jgi:predicted DNA binding CopG/RHH family protein